MVVGRRATGGVGGAAGGRAAGGGAADGRAADGGAAGGRAAGGGAAADLASPGRLGPAGRRSRHQGAALLTMGEEGGLVPAARPSSGWRGCPSQEPYPVTAETMPATHGGLRVPAAGVDSRP
ncbi:MAG: hypothetical protein ACYCU7_16385 [Acidimicrobiales bacterium]